MFAKDGYAFVRAADHQKKCTYALGFEQGLVRMLSEAEEFARMLEAFERTRDSETKVLTSRTKLG